MEVVGALWTVACFVTGVAAFSHLENIYWFSAFMFFMGVAMFYIGVQFTFSTEDQFLNSARRGKQLRNEDFSEPEERKRIKSRMQFYRIWGIGGLVTGLISLIIPSLAIFSFLKIYF